MYIVPIAWLYVAVMMAVAEANHSSGTVLGAIITFVLYGVVPVALVMYLMGAPARRRAIRAKEQAELATHTASTVTPNADSQTPADPIAAVRKEA
jgi:mannose/fructose/N-acetylgalactosamine-specific phosphotransferase system component IID